MPALTDLEALYRETVLAHYRSPRNRVPLHDPHGTALVHNPVCGDQVRVEVRVRAGRIEELAAISRGCSIAVASGSVMTEWARGREPHEVVAMRASLETLVSGADPGPSLPDSLRAFGRVAELPSRRRCALLAWEALETAIQGIDPQRIE